MSPRLQLILTAVLALGAGSMVAGFLGGYLEGARSPTTKISLAPTEVDSTQASTIRSEQAMAQQLVGVIGKIRREYVDELSADEWLERTLRSLVASLDGHSAYLDVREHEAVLRNVAGRYPGVGIEVAATDGRIKILRILAESPAERAGLRAGDEILAVDDAPVATNAGAAIAQMRGPKGTLVGLTVRRLPDGELVELALERTEVDVKSVSAQMLERDLGYLRIHAFSDTTPMDFLDAVGMLKREAPMLAGLVLDLRDNPGGVLESATAVADALLETGVIVSAEGRAEDAMFQMAAGPGDVLQGVNVLVLINRNSASAAEILAGALQDHGRATLAGSRTYGKGSVQSVIPLAGGQAIKLTTSRYTTPSGRRIQAEGIEPDIAIAEADTIGSSPQTDSTVRAAVAELRRSHLSNRTRTADTRAPGG